MGDTVRIYENALPHSECDALVEKFEQNPSYRTRQLEGQMSFTQIDFLEHAKVFGGDQAHILDRSFPYIQRYKKDTNAQFPSQYSFEAIRMKKYEPNGVDQFGTHIDVTTLANSRRWLVFFYYLSDNEEGSTVIEPIGGDPVVSPCKKGALLFFPPFWTHPHRGEAPIAKPKYIVGGYLHHV